MSRKYKLAAVIGLAVVMLAVVIGGQALAQGGTPQPSSTPAPGGMMGNNPMMGGRAVPGGMMGGYPGMMGSTAGITGTLPYWVQSMMGSTAGITGTLPYWVQQMMSNGMMGMMGSGQFGYGMMGNGMMGMMGNGMMGGWSDPNAKPLTLDQAQAAAQKYVQWHRQFLSERASSATAQ